MPPLFLMLGWTEGRPERLKGGNRIIVPAHWRSSQGSTD
jgi:hypothetical protein